MMTSDVAERVVATTEVIQRCIDILNEIEGIEARADAAGWLAKAYRNAADNANSK